MFERIRNKNVLSPVLFVALSLALTALLIVLRFVNLLCFFDYDIGYYQRGAALPIIMNALLVLSVLFFAVASIFITRAPKSLCGYEKNSFTIIGSSLCALTFLALGINFSLFSIALPSHIQLNAKIISLYAVFSMLAALYFISNIVNFIGKYRALFAIPLIINAVSILAISYFDITIQMNSPQKLLLHVACLASMFFFITEARCIFEDMRKKLYIFWLCTGIFFSGVYSVPSLIYFAINGISDYTFITFIITFFAVFVYLVTRAVTLMISSLKADTADCDTEAPKPQEEENI